MCKNEVHPIRELYLMMQGKPMKLSSEFRLTYSMILNLLRVERLRVEDMMMRSFSEVERRRKETSVRARLEELKKRRSNLAPMRSDGLTAELTHFFETATKFISIKEKNWNLILNQQGVSKALAAGRIVLINLENDINVPAVLLGVDSASHEKNLNVLVLKNSTKPKRESASIEDYLALAIRKPNFGTLSISGRDHSIISVKACALTEITRTLLKIDAEKIVSDMKRREIPRFADSPLGQSTVHCIEQLQKYCSELETKEVDLFNWLKDFKIQDLSLLSELQAMSLLTAEISTIGTLLGADFRSTFSIVYDRQVIENEIKSIEWALGEESLTNMEDYQKMIDVLCRLKYIDGNKTVQLKGRVACEMGSHELLVTELVFDNVLTDRPPAEIAALLSCLVFQQRNCSAPGKVNRMLSVIFKLSTIHLFCRAHKILGNGNRSCEKMCAYNRSNPKTLWHEGE